MFEERFKAYPSTVGMSVVLTITMEPDDSESTLGEDSEDLVPISTPVSDVLTNVENISEETSSKASSIPTPLATPVSTPFVESLSTNESSLTPSPTPFETLLPEDDVPVQEVLVTTTPTFTGTGYITFSANEDGNGATVVLIDSNDEEHIAGRITQGSHVVSIEIGTDFYRAYRIEKDGYASVTGYLYDYPDTDGENREITVVLNEEFFTITTAAGPNGQVTPSDGTTVKAGETLTIQISPSPGYRIEIVQVDGEVLEDPGSEYTFTNIQSDHVLVASFN
jgi:hypothetical protein